MTEETVAAALEREHNEIDAQIAEFVAGLKVGEVRAEPIARATAALKRHIYIEEAFLFPPMRSGGLTMPIFVMIREHGDIWRMMDVLAQLVAAGSDLPAAREVCDQMVVALESHNVKEEAVIYPQAEGAFSAEAEEEMKRFLATGSTPDGWVCQAAAPR